MKPILAIASLCILAAVAFADPAPTPPQTRTPVAVDSALFRFALDAASAETLQPVATTLGYVTDDQRIANLERRVDELEKRCKCVVAPQASESKPAGIVCDENGCRIVSQGGQQSSGGSCASGSCGPASGGGWQPFGGRFRRR